MRSIIVKFICLGMALSMNAYAQTAPGQGVDAGAQTIAGTVEQVDIANGTLRVNGEIFSVPATAPVMGLVADKESGLRAVREGMNVRLMLEASSGGATPGRLSSIIIIPD